MYCYKVKYTHKFELFIQELPNLHGLITMRLYETMEFGTGLNLAKVWQKQSIYKVYNPHVKIYTDNNI